MESLKRASLKEVLLKRKKITRISVKTAVDDPRDHQRHAEFVDDRIEELSQFAYSHSVLFDVGRVRVHEVAVSREYQVDANPKSLIILRRSELGSMDFSCKLIKIKS